MKPMHLLMVTFSLFTILVFFSNLYNAQAQTSPTFEKILSGSYPETITVTGQGSKWVESDQVTVSVNVLSHWENSTSSTIQNQTVQQIVDKLKSVSPQSLVSVGSVTINPRYDNWQSTSPTYQAFSLVHVTTDMASFENISANLTQAKISIQDLTVTQVPQNQTSPVNITRVSINAGSGESPACASDNTCFTPQKINVTTGDQIIWENNDKVSHTITSGSPADTISGSMFDSGIMKPTSTFSYVFLNPGTFDYFCQVHPWMTGIVVVTGNSLVSADDKGAKYKVNISIPINTVQDTLYGTIKKYTAQLDQVKEILKSGGISSKEISIDPLRISMVNSGQQAINGYDQNIGVTIDTSLNDLPKVIDTINNAGSSAGAITMTVSKKGLDSVKQDLAKQALADALDQAQQIASGAGLSVTSIKDIQLSPLLTQDNVQRYGGPYTITQSSFYSSGQMSITATVQFELGK
ncbi:MAG TPA: SIMPL domain-containing protein [Candidatus Nitrosotalea sp.]|nr:SIMPL domain-containing protein [Candidatus Nitrosotalea sp.]